MDVEVPGLDSIWVVQHAGGPMEFGRVGSCLAASVVLARAAEAGRTNSSSSSNLVHVLGLFILAPKRM